MGNKNWSRLGEYECFTRVFGIGLTDNRSEFKMVDMFEKSTTN